MRSFLKIVLCLLVCTTLAMGQAARTATLVGTVTDPAGALVPNAKITLTHASTGFVSNGVTNAEGAYYVPFLAVGMYQLKIEAPGFKVYIRDGIELRAAEVPRVNVRLEVGATSESVQVTGAAPLLETETSQVSQTMAAKAIIEIPVHQMKIQRLIFYAAGTQDANAALGQPTGMLGFTLDGISGKQDLTYGIDGTNNSVQPALDALAEAKVYTTGAPAELGHVAGGLLAATFKSGTNQLHGSFEDRMTTNKLTHRGYLQQGALVNPMTYQQILSAVDGPVYLPKIYDGRNKTFFLFAYGRHDERSREPQVGTVPDLDMLNGNFSFPLATGGGYPIYDPKSISQVGSTWTATVFPNMQIPKGRFDPVAVNFLATDPWKPPNNAEATTYSRSTGPSNNWIGETLYRSYRGRFDVKIDHQISPNNKFFVRDSHNRHRQPWARNLFAVNNHLIESSNFGVGRPQLIDLQNWAAADYHTFNATTMNELRVGFMRRRATIDPPTAGQGWAKKLGIPNVGPENFPSFGLYNIGPGSFSRTISEDLTFQNNVTKLLSRHTIKFGYEVIRTRQNNVDSVLPSGDYSFSTAGTALPFTPNTGNNFASFLLGSVSSATFTQQIWNRLPRWWSHAAYLQTDWKVRPNLTLNLGLRYSLETPFRDKWDHQSQFDPTVVDPLTGRMGAITHPTGGAYKTDRNNFQPRVGLAWNFNSKMVFRGAWGMVAQDMLASAGFEDYTATAVVQAPTGDPRPAFYLSQGPPNRNFILNADGTSQYLGTNYSSRGATFIDSNLRVPYVMNWSGSIQTQMGPTWITEVLYQGATGVKSTSNVNMNQLSQSIWDSTDVTYLNQVRSAAQNYKPYTQFGTIRYLTNGGHNTYHALTTRVEKRYAADGLTVNANYTWAKSLSGTVGDGWQYYDWSLTKGPTGRDVRHSFVLQGSYDLPVGKGRKWLSSGEWLSHVIGGWNLLVVAGPQSGRAATLSFSGSPYRYLSGGPSRPNQLVANDQVKVANWSMGEHRFPQSAQNPFYDINAFAYPTQFTHGTLGAGTQRGRWTFGNQWSVSKRWRIVERYTFTLRLDGNNIPVRFMSTTPDTAVNLSSPESFGKFGLQGGMSYDGMAQTNGQLIVSGRFAF